MSKTEQTITSVEVAEMVSKKHGNLIRDIRNYVEQLNQLNIETVEFFTESTYKDSKGETRPYYNVTKKGCEFIAHKLTGIKGTQARKLVLKWVAPTFVHSGTKAVQINIVKE